MAATIVNLLIELIAGALGGNAVGAVGGNANMGPGGSAIAGALGGVAGGSLMTSLIPMLSGGADYVDIGAYLGQLAAGGVSGAIVSAVVGMIRNHINKA